jgi:hypothetical protein
VARKSKGASGTCSSTRTGSSCMCLFIRPTSRITMEAGFY